MGRGEESLQKGVSPADMALLPSVQGWPLAGVWELGFQESSLRSLTDSMACCVYTVCTDSVAYGEHWPPASLQRVWCLARAYVTHLK